MSIARPPSRARRSGFTLLEMISALILITILSAAAAWTLRAHLSTNARIARQTDRHAGMRSILHWLRRDVAAAARIALEETQTPDSTGADSANLVISSAAGEVRYALLLPAPAADGPIEPGAAAEQRWRDAKLRRTAAGHAPIEWPLRGMRLKWRGGKSDRLLPIEFDLSQSYASGDDVPMRYATTLYAGGRP